MSELSPSLLAVLPAEVREAVAERLFTLRHGRHAKFKRDRLKISGSSEAWCLQEGNKLLEPVEAFLTHEDRQGPSPRAVVAARDECEVLGYGTVRLLDMSKILTCAYEIDRGVSDE